MKRNRLILCIAAMLGIILMSMLLTSCTGKHEITEIDTVELKKNGNISVKANISEEYLSSHKKDDVYLLSMDSCEGIGAVIVGKARIRSEMSFSVPLYDNNKSRISCGFALASYTEATSDTPAGYTLLTEIKYISNPEILASTSVNDNSTSGIKGIAIEDSSEVIEATYLGASKALFEIRLDRLISSRNAENTTIHNLSGFTYYYDSDYLSQIDSAIIKASDCGMKVYVRLILGMPVKGSDGKYPYEKTDILYCANASSGKEGYLPDMSSPEAVGYIDAAVDFLTERYSYLVSDYIVGKNMNTPAQYNNAGDMTTDRYYFFCNAYVRHVYNILRSHVSNGKVYVSIDNAWAASAAGGKAFLNAFAENSKESGDYDWNVALSLSAENRTSGIVWNDSPQANPYITVNCLYELTDFLQTSRFIYNGNMRKIVISDFSLSGKSLSEIEEYRAASYVYTYAKILENGYIDAFIYSSFCGENDGLRDANGSYGYLYTAFMTCASNSTSAIKPLTEKIGDKWNNNLRLALSNGEKYQYYTCTDVIRSTEGLRSYSNLFDFSAGESFGFTTSGRAKLLFEQYIDEEGKALSALSVDMYGDDGWSRVVKKNMTASDLLSSKYISFDLSGEGGSKVVLMITDYSSKDGKILRFQKEFTCSGQRETYCFDISGFTKSIKSQDSIEICLMVEPASEEDEMNLTLYKTDLYGTSAKMQSLKYVILIIVLVIAAVVALMVVFVIIGKKRRQEEDDDEDDEDDEE